MGDRNDKRPIRCVGGPCPSLVIHGPDIPEWMPVGGHGAGYKLDMAGDEPVYRWQD